MTGAPIVRYAAGMMRMTGLLSSGLFLLSSIGVAACGGGDASTAAAASSGGAVGGGGSGGSGSGAGGGSNEPTPNPAFLPVATGPCPEFVEGKITVSPDGKPRDVQIWISDAAKTLDGPLLFYWHGTGSSPVVEPPYGLSNATITAVKDLGGMVVAPYHDPAAGQFPWFLTTGSGPEDDIRVADEVLACAIEKVGVDLRRIHEIGMSAGGLNTTQMSWRRSGYLASVVTYSGGKLGDPPDQDPSNKFPAMIFHGGANDTVIVNFKSLSEQYAAELKSKGHFAFICDHGGGHSIPTDARKSVWQFFQDHPFGTSPSPYESGLPDGFPTYCSL